MNDDIPGAERLEEILAELRVDEVLAEKGPLLHAAARAWLRIPVEGKGVPLGFAAPQGNQLADDAAVGDLVLIPNYGLWRMALVVALDVEHSTHVWVSCPDHAGPSLTYRASFPLERPATFPMPRTNLYRPQRLSPEPSPTR